MFTGIIEDLGEVIQIKNSGDSYVLGIRSEKILEDTRLGDSIAVNGVCLTVTTIRDMSFTADVMPETLKCSSLGELRVGSRVNLERAMIANGRFGGHIVSGHIDGVGRIRRLTRDKNAVWVEIAAGPDILRLIVEKGSIAIDGISLTVARVTDSSFSVSIIPHTGMNTTLLSRSVGDIVNLENDILGKYVDRLLQAGSKGSEGLSMNTLFDNGFI